MNNFNHSDFKHSPMIFSILAVLAKIGRKLPSKSCNCRIYHLIPSVFWCTSCQFYTNIFLLYGWPGKTCKLPNIRLGNKMIVYMYLQVTCDWLKFTLLQKKTIENKCIFILEQIAIELAKVLNSPGPPERMRTWGLVLAMFSGL